MVNNVILHHQTSPLILFQCCSSSYSSPPPPPHIPRGFPGKLIVKCSIKSRPSSKVVASPIISGLAASLIFLSQTNQVLAADLSHNLNICQLASAMDTKLTRPLEEDSGEGNGKLMMMRVGVCKKLVLSDWNPVLVDYLIFITGVYTIDMKTPAIQVDTFCVHGGPDGYITGIKGQVQCLSEEDLVKNETDLERQEMIKEKCYLRFPTLPYIPKEPYDVIATDYDNFSLVYGSKGRSFIQIYSRTPNPGHEFIEKYKAYLANFGYDPSKIKDAPQDCQVMSNSQLAAMMSMSGMQQALTNQFPDLELKAPVEFNTFTSVFETLKKLVELYFK
ncbi:hypothetical protein REPUB_Repub05bG0035500 [Reevesia pubescens]